MILKEDLVLGDVSNCDFEAIKKNAKQEVIIIAVHVLKIVLENSKGVFVRAVIKLAIAVLSSFVEDKKKLDEPCDCGGGGGEKQEENNKKKKNE